MDRADHVGLLRGASASDFAGDPRPGWAGVATLFGAAVADLPSLPACDFAVAGVPFDSTASSRPGAAEGPSVIRQASRSFAAYLDSLGEHEMFDTRIGRPFRYRKAKLVDVGDFHVYPSNLARTVQALAAEAEMLCRSASTVLFLGGDHSISFPLFSGVREAVRKENTLADVGYVQIDHHFDFGNESAIHGAVYHGSNARRISELTGLAPARFAFVGIGAVTRRDQYEFLLRNNVHVVMASDIRSHGAVRALSKLIADFRKLCTSVYLSIDIDVLNCAEAPGTGGLTVGGVDLTALLDVLEALRALPVRALDLVEVAPRYDPTGRTALIAAHILFEWIHRCPPGGS